MTTLREVVERNPTRSTSVWAVQKWAWAPQFGVGCKRLDLAVDLALSAKGNAEDNCLLAAVASRYSHINSFTHILVYLDLPHVVEVPAVGGRAPFKVERKA
eukprot:SAG22_NODE_10562_length_528_cov_0.433566_1_plen_100_part_01